MRYCRKCGSEIPEEATYCPKCGTPVETISTLKLAYWGERFVAWLIDVIILAIVLAPIKWFWSMAWPSFTWVPSFLTWIPFVDFGLSNVVYLLYWALMEASLGQSLGKMLMRIKVTRLNGEPISVAQAAIESVGKAFLLPLDCILGWILYPSKRQRMFNYISETIVVKT